MNKIEWDLEKEVFLPETHSVLICGYCGWLIQNPQPGDAKCDNCGKLYEKTNSKIHKIKRRKDK
jgi:hypothetical protein